MKFILSFIGVAIIAVAVLFCGQTNNVDDDYMRIHIVANSNSVEDQNLKYLVKDAVVEFLIPILADAKNKDQAKDLLVENVEKIEEVANVVLKTEGVDYFASVSIKNEEMPTRAYNNLVLESGVYESLNIALGDAKGDNWWCVVFPAVCFVDTKNYENLEYISKILDTIYRVTN